MFTKLLLIASRASTLKVLASLIIVTIFALFFYQWLIQSPITPSSLSTTYTTTLPGNSNNFNISQWTISLVEKLAWQQEGSSLFLNTLVLFMFLAVATSLGLPRQIAALVAGINLGALIGVVIATLAATLGCLITFSVARYLLSASISRKYPTQLSKLSNFLGERTFIKAIVIRILPLGSNFITNIIAGVTKVSMPAYVCGSFVGFIPQMIIFSLAGSGIRLGAQNELIISALLFVVALALTGYLIKKHKGKSLQ